jgi:aspartyl protease family protein
MPERDSNSSSYPQRVGKTMIIMAWLVLLFLLSWIFSLYLDQQRNPNSDIRSYNVNDAREIELQRNRYGHYVASGRINGKEVTFMLDTGATIVGVPGHLADVLSLQRGAPLQMATANGTITVYSTVIDEVQLGDIRLRDVRASINTTMQEDEVLLGMSFLRQLDFSQQGDRLTLRQHLTGSSAE